MDYERMDLISLFDLEFHNDKVSPADLRKLRDAHGHQDLENLYAESRNWIFGREPLSGLERFCFASSKRLAYSNGSSILVSPEHGAGVFSVWQTIADGSDPLKFKQHVWESGDPYQQVTQLNLDIVESDREYPFLAVRVPTGDLDTFCRENATYLGRLFTGNYEDEEARYLEEYVKVENNISRRRYERISSQSDTPFTSMASALLWGDIARRPI